MLNAIYDIVDGCAVQYRCGTVLHSLAHLAKARNICYTRCIQAPGHGKAEVDAEGGEAKSAAQKHFERPALHPEGEEASGARFAICQCSVTFHPLDVSWEHGEGVL